MYLAAAGVGQLVLADFDTVDLSNLQRQILHGSHDIGRPKVESARDTLQVLNPEVAVSTLSERLEGEALAEQIRAADLVVDATDNFATRFMLTMPAWRSVTIGLRAAIVWRAGIGVPYERDDSPVTVVSTGMRVS